MSGFKLGTPIFFDDVKEEMELMSGGSVSDSQVRLEMAKQANKTENSNNNANEAIKAANGHKESYGDGVSTRIIVYNASGSRLNLRNDKTFTGRWSQFRLPETIEVGEWATGLHVKRTGSASGSFGIYSYNVEGEPLVFVTGWGTPWSGSNHGSCYSMKTDGWGKTSWNTIEKWCEEDPDQKEDICGNLKVNYHIDQQSSPLLKVYVRRVGA